MQPQQSPLAPLLGEVVERETTTPPVAPTLPASAQHSGQSRFARGGFPAVGRRDVPSETQKRLEARRAARLDAAAPAHAQHAVNSVAHRRLLDPAHSGSIPGVADAGSILHENSRRVALMGDEERAAALAEIEGMFSETTLLAMRKRYQRNAGAAPSARNELTNAASSAAPPVAGVSSAAAVDAGNAAGGTSTTAFVPSVSTEQELWAAAVEYLPAAEQAKLAWTGRIPPSPRSPASAGASSHQHQRGEGVGTDVCESDGGSTGARALRTLHHHTGDSGGTSIVHDAFGRALHDAAVVAATRHLPPASTDEAAQTAHPHSLLTAALSAQLSPPLIGALLQRSSAPDADRGPADALVASIAEKSVADAGLQDSLSGEHSSARTLLFDRQGVLLLCRRWAASHDSAGPDTQLRPPLNAAGFAPARTSSGGSLTGQSVMQLCTLIRSAIPNQRMAAARALGGLLSRRRAAFLDPHRPPPAAREGHSAESDGASFPAESLTTVCELQSRAAPNSTASLQRESIASAWRCEAAAMQSLALPPILPVLLRCALDDAHPAALAASLSAMEELLGCSHDYSGVSSVVCSGFDHEPAAEAGDAAAQTGATRALRAVIAAAACAPLDDVLAAAACAAATAALPTDPCQRAAHVDADADAVVRPTLSSVCSLLRAKGASLPLVQPQPPPLQELVLLQQQQQQQQSLAPARMQGGGVARDAQGSAPHGCDAAPRSAADAALDGLLALHDPAHVLSERMGLVERLCSVVSAAMYPSGAVVAASAAHTRLLFSARCSVVRLLTALAGRGTLHAHRVASATVCVPRKWAMLTPAATAANSAAAAVSDEREHRESHGSMIVVGLLPWLAHCALFDECVVDACVRSSELCPCAEDEGDSEVDGRLDAGSGREFLGRTGSDAASVQTLSLASCVLRLIVAVVADSPDLAARLCSDGDTEGVVQEAVRAASLAQDDRVSSTEDSEHEAATLRLPLGGLGHVRAPRPAPAVTSSGSSSGSSSSVGMLTLDPLLQFLPLSAGLRGALAGGPHETRADGAVHPLVQARVSLAWEALRLLKVCCSHGEGVTRALLLYAGPGAVASSTSPGGSLRAALYPHEPPHTVGLRCVVDSLPRSVRSTASDDSEQPRDSSGVYSRAWWQACSVAFGVHVLAVLESASTAIVRAVCEAELATVRNEPLQQAALESLLPLAAHLQSCVSHAWGVFWDVTGCLHERAAVHEGEQSAAVLASSALLSMLEAYLNDGVSGTAAQGIGVDAHASTTARHGSASRAGSQQPSMRSSTPAARRLSAEYLPHILQLRPIPAHVEQIPGGSHAQAGPAIAVHITECMVRPVLHMSDPASHHGTTAAAAAADKDEDHEEPSHRLGLIRRLFRTLSAEGSPVSPAAVASAQWLRAYFDVVCTLLRQWAAPVLAHFLRLDGDAQHTPTLNNNNSNSNISNATCRQPVLRELRELLEGILRGGNAHAGVGALAPPCSLLAWLDHHAPMAALAGVGVAAAVSLVGPGPQEEEDGGATPARMGSSTTWGLGGRWSPLVLPLACAPMWHVTTHGAAFQVGTATLRLAAALRCGGVSVAVAIADADAACAAKSGTTSSNDVEMLAPDQPHGYDDGLARFAARLVLEALPGCEATVLQLVRQFILHGACPPCDDPQSGTDVSAELVGSLLSDSLGSLRHATPSDGAFDTSVTSQVARAHLHLPVTASSALSEVPRILRVVATTLLRDDATLPCAPASLTAGLQRSSDGDGHARRQTNSVGGMPSASRQHAAVAHQHAGVALPLHPLWPLTLLQATLSASGAYSVLGPRASGASGIDVVTTERQSSTVSVTRSNDLPLWSSRPASTLRALLGSLIAVSESVSRVELDGVTSHSPLLMCLAPALGSAATTSVAAAENSRHPAQGAPAPVVHEAVSLLHAIEAFFQLLHAGLLSSTVFASDASAPTAPTLLSALHAALCVTAGAAVQAADGARAGGAPSAAADPASAIVSPSVVSLLLRHPKYGLRSDRSDYAPPPGADSGDGGDESAAHDACASLVHSLSAALCAEFNGGADAHAGAAESLLWLLSAAGRPRISLQLRAANIATAAAVSQCGLPVGLPSRAMAALVDVPPTGGRRDDANLSAGVTVAASALRSGILTALVEGGAARHGSWPSAVDSLWAPTPRGRNDASLPALLWPLEADHSVLDGWQAVALAILVDVDQHREAVAHRTTGATSSRVSLLLHAAVHHLSGAMFGVGDTHSALSNAPHIPFSAVERARQLLLKLQVSSTDAALHLDGHACVALLCRMCWHDCTAPCPKGPLAHAAAQQQQALQRFERLRAALLRGFGAKSLMPLALVADSTTQTIEQLLLRVGEALRGWQPVEAGGVL